MVARILILSFLSLMTNCSLSQTVQKIYVSPNGSDKNLGSTENPFKTLERAKLAIAAIKKNPAPTKVSKIEIIVREGQYDFDETLTFSQQEGGDSSLQINFSAYPGEKVIFSGGKKLKSTWVRSTGNLWKTTLDIAGLDLANVRSLYINGKRAPRSTSDTLYTKGALPQFHNDFKKYKFAAIQKMKLDSLDAFCGFSYNDGDLDGLKDLNNLEVIVYHSWEASWHKVYKINTDDKSVILKSPFRYPIGYFNNRVRYRIENSKTFLTKEGMWCTDIDSRELWYMAAPNEDPNKMEFTIPNLERLVQLGGNSAQKAVSNLSFTQISFRYSKSKWGVSDFPAKYQEDQKNTRPWLDFRSGFTSAQMALDCGESVLLKNAINCSFDKCEFTDLENYAIRIGEYSKQNSITESKFSSLGGGAIIIGFDDRDPIKRGIPFTASPSGNSVKDCSISDVGLIHPSGVGIAILQANHNIISHNRLSNLPYSGICVGWTFDSKKNYTSDNIIEDNYVSDVLTVLADGGGIYTLGSQPGTIIRGNYITGIGKSLNAIGSTNNGLFFDEGSSDFIIENNVVTNIQNQDIRFNKSDKGKINFKGNYFQKTGANKELKSKLEKKWH